MKLKKQIDKKYMWHDCIHIKPIYCLGSQGKGNEIINIL